LKKDELFMEVKMHNQLKNTEKAKNEELTKRIEELEEKTRE